MSTRPIHAGYPTNPARHSARCPHCNRLADSAGRHAATCAFRDSPAITVQIDSRAFQVRPASFWKRVRKSDGCWIWSGHVERDGYGRVSTFGHKHRATRLAWALTNGPIPAGQQICHRCDVPLCVRPDHLFLGTPLDNMRDKTRKGRQTKGADVTGAKLTPERVQQMRSIRGRSQSSIAAEFGVCQQTVSRVLNKHRWGHV